MNKMTWAMIAIGIVVALTVAVCLFPPVSLVTNKTSEVVSVTVTFDPENGGQMVTYYEDAAQEIHRLLAQTTAKACRYPGHGKAQTSDPQYTISVEYQNGETDEIRSAENPAFVYRYLLTYGPDGDKGYLYGTNQALADYIASLQE